MLVKDTRPRLGLSVKDIRPLVRPCLFFVIFCFALMILISHFSAKGKWGFFQRFTLLLFYWKEKTIPQHATAIFRVSDARAKGGRLQSLSGREEMKKKSL